MFDRIHFWLSSWKSDKMMKEVKILVRPEILTVTRFESGERRKLQANSSQLILKSFLFRSIHFMLINKLLLAFMTFSSTFLSLVSWNEHTQHQHRSTPTNCICTRSIGTFLCFSTATKSQITKRAESLEPSAESSREKNKPSQVLLTVGDESTENEQSKSKKFYFSRSIPVDMFSTPLFFLLSTLAGKFHFFHSVALRFIMNVMSTRLDLTWLVISSVLCIFGLPPSCESSHRRFSSHWKQKSSRKIIVESGKRVSTIFDEFSLCPSFCYFN